jgi:hypothetical protein
LDQTWIQSEVESCHCAHYLSPPTELVSSLEDRSRNDEGIALTKCAR